MREGTKDVLHLFISYAHEDERWKDNLVKTLTPLIRKGLISIWEDRQICVGDN
jgi:hypothetical protein